MRVRVRISDLERGDLPAICAKTGQPCANAHGVVLRPGSHLWSPGGVRIDAVIPIAAARVRQRRALARAAWVLLAVFGAALLASLAGGGGFAFTIAVGAFVVYVALVLTGDRMWVGAQMGNEREVYLTRVHHEFTRAVDAQYGRGVSR
jgi:hypothetical protein